MGNPLAEEEFETQPLDVEPHVVEKPASPGVRMFLLVYHQDGAEAVPLEDGAQVVVGREEPSDCRVVDVTLSRQHARFRRSGNVLTVEDLESRNGTWISGMRVRRAELCAGDEVMLGSVMVAIHSRGRAEPDARGLEGDDRVRRALDDELVRARHFGRGLALLMVRTLNPGEHVSRWAEAVRERMRPVDRVGLYSKDTLEIVLPEITPAAAYEVARQVTVEISPPLVVGVATFPDAAATGEELIEVCRGALLETNEVRRVGVARTREADANAAVHRGLPVAVSAAMKAVLEQVDRVAPSSLPVLVHGETGTGKELVARALHERSPRRRGRMVCLNCAAIPAQLVESTLFGHERGAFTGADAQRRGAFEDAHGGTLLLDEVGELPPAAQAALLRVLETHRVMRVGSTREIEVEVRIIAATHRDLEEMAREGKFRADLVYRLNGITLAIPPLRERREEIRPLALRFLQRANETNGRAVRRIDERAIELLEGYDWPGNVRELRNAIERAIVIARSDSITVDDLPERVRGGRPVTPLEESDAAALHAKEIKARVVDYEGKMIYDALRAAHGNQTEAAKRLGMPLRTLVRKVKALGLKVRVDK